MVALAITFGSACLGPNTDNSRAQRASPMRAFGHVGQAVPEVCGNYHYLSQQKISFHLCQFKLSTYSATWREFQGLIQFLLHLSISSNQSSPRDVVPRFYKSVYEACRIGGSKGKRMKWEEVSSKELDRNQKNTHQCFVFSVKGKHLLGEKRL